MKKNQPQNRCFVRGFPQFSSHLTKCHAGHGICTLAPLDAALTLRFAKTRNATRLKCCACLPRKTTMGTSKVLRQLRKLQRIFCKRRKSMAPTTQNDFHTLQNSSECHDVPRLPRETKPRDDWNLQKWPLLQAALTRTVANGCERLRTTADVNAATWSEHTLNPQTPRVKREPLLRIREKEEGCFSHGVWWQKSKTGRVPNLTDFLLLCALKSTFFLPQRPPPRMVEIHGKQSGLSSTGSNHFGKLACKRTYIQYGGDTGFHQRKGRFPLSNRIQRSKIIGWGKTKAVGK